MTMHDQPPPNTTSSNPPASDTDIPTDAERREALRKLGALAALTPPTVMTLLISRRASAASPGSELNLDIPDPT